MTQSGTGKTPVEDIVGNGGLWKLVFYNKNT